MAPDSRYFTLARRNNNVRFEYAGISYRSGGEIFYRYKLSGLDTGWLTTKENFLTYPTLLPGDYTMHLQAINKFGVESELAPQYRELGKGDSLGDAARGRVDGNLFLVFWIGNLVGTHDTASPDGDHRFFKDKLDELPRELVEETRRRNSAYIVWLAKHLRG